MENKSENKAQDQSLDAIQKNIDRLSARIKSSKGTSCADVFKRLVELNYKRLNDEEYSLERLFQSEDYDWPGDWEGRALLAFLCHYRIHARLVPHFFDAIDLLPKKTNPYLYFGKPFDGVTVDEQQLSGHNWYLRALLLCDELFHNTRAMEYAKSVVENLYLPVKEWYSRYPLDGRAEVGDVSGSLTSEVNGWRLSSDVGCAFMCVDGLANYFRRTHDVRVYELLEAIIKCFESVDLMKYKLQTHTTLTCLRGILTLYRATKNKKYLNIVIDKFTFYQEHGMTLTYENFNWFGREDTWTEPCAVVDSFILANELYLVTGKPEYATLARRIWFNGLQFCLRDNGGAGPNTCVTDTQGVLKIAMYEAPFCCTMRYAEGLLCYYYYCGTIYHNENAEPVIDSHGRKFVDDVMIVRYNGKEMPIFSASLLSKKETEEAELLIIR